MLYFDNKIHEKTYISLISLISLKKYIFTLACELHFKNKLYGFQVSGHFFAVFYYISRGNALYSYSLVPRSFKT